MKKLIILLNVFLLIVILKSTSPALPTSREQSALGSLYWGINPTTGKVWTVKDLLESAKARVLSPVGKEVRNVLRSAQSELEKSGSVQPIERIEMEGILATEERYQRSGKAVKILPAMTAWAFCARLEADTEAGKKCRAALFAGLFGENGNHGWLGIYKPTGNPIDESNLLPLIQTIDFAKPLLTKPQTDKTESFLKTIISQGDRFFTAKKSGNTSRINNHNTWRLTIRAAAAKVLNDKTELAETRRLFSQQVVDDLMEPPGWKPDEKCANNSSETRYGGYDFRQRDALHYHIYNLEAFIFTATFIPEMFGEQERKAISNALDFLRPYFTEEKIHREFVCSSVRFDRQRAEAGLEEYMTNPWKPERARKLLRNARPLFPEVKSWTANIVDEKYSPVAKLTAALHGEKAK
jgi:hypothetical protein